MVDKKHKSDWEKDNRRTIGAEVARIAKKDIKPEACSYKVNHRWAERRLTGAFNLKSTRD